MDTADVVQHPGNRVGLSDRLRERQRSFVVLQRFVVLTLQLSDDAKIAER